jgi:uncharacterized protein GlcG (DUF336 family)
MHIRYRMAGLAALWFAAAPAGAAEQDLIVQYPQLTSLAAQRLVEACTNSTAAPMAVAVVDPAGNLLHFHANQGASPTAPITAQLKAVTAARWRRSTSQLAGQVTNGGSGAVFLGDYPVGGGLPIVQGPRTLGAIGVAGPENPEACAEKAVKAVFGDAVEIGRPD